MCAVVIFTGVKGVQNIWGEKIQISDAVLTAETLVVLCRGGKTFYARP